MPELPEVEAVCRRLRREVKGARVRKTRVLRPSTVRPQSPEAVASGIDGRTIMRIERRGKNILLHLDSTDVVRIHLRMTGDLYVIADGRFLESAIRVAWDLVGGGALVFRDRRALGKVHLHTREEIIEVLKGVGVEPLTPAFTVERFIGLAAKSRQPAKLFLMDQKHVAGLGNMYAAEALFRARIHPAQPVNTLSKRKLQLLHAAILQVLKDAVQSVKRSYSSREHLVYGRLGESCKVCGRPILRISQGGRSTYYCGKCQRNYA